VQHGSINAQVIPGLVVAILDDPIVVSGSTRPLLLSIRGIQALCKETLLLREG